MYNTKYVRCLMAFWYISFMRLLKLDFGFLICEFVNGMFMYGSSYSRYDGDEGVRVPSVVSDGVI